MTVLVRFVAFASKVPKTQTVIDIEEGSSLAELLKQVWEKWKDDLKEYGSSGFFLDHVLAASNHVMLQPDDTLRDKQEVVIVGQIIGG